MPTDKYGNDVNEHGQMTKKEFISRWKEHVSRYDDAEKPLPEITCDECPSATDGDCEWAYDLYNTDGDCLGMK